MTSLFFGYASPMFMFVTMDEVETYNLHLTIFLQPRRR
jgi:hypothetical protein